MFRLPARLVVNAGAIMSIRPTRFPPLLLHPTMAPLICDNINNTDLLTLTFSFRSVRSRLGEQYEGQEEENAQTANNLFFPPASGAEQTLPTNTVPGTAGTS